MGWFTPEETPKQPKGAFLGLFAIKLLDDGAEMETKEDGTIVLYTSDRETCSALTITCNPQQMPKLKYTSCKISDYRCTYPGQMEPQRAFYDLDLERDTVFATYDPEVGNAIPFRTWYGVARRYYFDPNLKKKVVNSMGKALLPLFERVRRGAVIELDNGNYKAYLNEDAKEAELEIENKIIELSYYV